MPALLVKTGRALLAGSGQYASAGGGGDVTPPTLVSATVDAAGTLLTLVFSEAVVGVVSGDYAMSGGHSLLGALGSGTTWTMSVSQVYQGETLTLAYTPGTTEDLAGNDLAAIVAAAVTNNSTVFNPLTLSPVLWLKADAGTFQTSGGSAASADGDPVGEWQDQSGNGNHAAQATAGFRPSLQTGEQNSLPTIQLDGVDDRLTLTATEAMSPCSLFVITKMIDAGADDGGWLGGAGDTRAFVVDDDRYLIMDGTNTALHANSAPTAYSLVEFHLNGSGYEIVENGASVGSGVTTFSGLFDSIGVYGGTPRYFKGYIGELFLTDAMLAGADRTNMRTYLEDRWGL